MQSGSIFRNLSPLDHRYYLANRELFEALADYLSEEAAVRACVRVETALLDHLVTHLAPEGADAAEWPRLIASLPERVTPQEVYEEEERTRHNIRAVVNVIQRHLPPQLQPLVHLGATSVDILDTAAALRYRDVTRHVLLPLLLRLEERIVDLVEREADTTSIGRTHGQFAVPITIGFAFAEYASRLGESIERIAALAGELRGKLAGAVGGNDATSVLHPDPVALEKAVLTDLGLAAGEHSTQIVAPEPLLRLLLEYNIAFGIIANLADDLRNLQRSEIAELAEYFAPEQVGSSTMPHKRNPWNAEHVKSLWKTFAPRVHTFFTDQISEHQRDLTNSASGRFVAEYLAGFAAAAARLDTILARLAVDREGVARNLAAGAERVVAEPLYILLAAGGIADAHERIRSLTLAADARDDTSVFQLARADGELWPVIESTYRRLTGRDAEADLADPERYTGRSGERARVVAATARRRIAALRAGLA